MKASKEEDGKVYFEKKIKVNKSTRRSVLRK